MLICKHSPIVKLVANSMINVLGFQGFKTPEKFFRESLPNIRQEMYEDFKDDMEDTDFDMYFRKAIAKYEGYDKIF